MAEEGGSLTRLALKSCAAAHRRLLLAEGVVLREQVEALTVKQQLLRWEEVAVVASCWR